MISIDVSYFAWVRERMGKGEESLVLPVGVGTVRELVAWLAARDTAGAAAFAEPGRIRVALAGEMANLDAVLTSGDAVSLFPPVTGG